MTVFLNIILYFIVFMIGASIFSFLNVVVYRLPRKMNYVSGRSICTSCQKTLKWYQLIPIFSFVFLGGKCGFCKEKISFRYTLMEIIGGAASVISFLKYADFLNFDYLSIPRYALVFAFTGVLVTIGFIDRDTMEIPNGLVIFTAVFGILSYFVFPEITVVQRLIGAVCVSVPLLVITLIINGAFGGGDIKLMAATGLFLGWKLNLVALFFGILTGGIYGIYVMATKKKDKKDHIAFGPFLCFGTIISLFAGEQILDWYLNIFNFI